MTAVTTWVVDCRDGVCIERGRPSTTFKPMAINVNTNVASIKWTYIGNNTNFQGDTITGIRDADFAKEAFQMQSGADSFNCDDILLGHGAVHPDTPMDTHPNDNLLGFPGSGVDNLAREDGYCFAEENADGYTEVEWTYLAENVGGTATQLQENCANGTFVKGGQLGYTEVEWTYLAENVGGTAGPGGTTFRTGYAEAVGLDGYMVCPEPQWVMNNLIGSAGPGCDDI